MILPDADLEDEELDVVRITSTSLSRSPVRLMQMETDIPSESSYTMLSNETSTNEPEENHSLHLIGMYSAPTVIIQNGDSG